MNTLLIIGGILTVILLLKDTGEKIAEAQEETVDSGPVKPFEPFLDQSGPSTPYNLDDLYYVYGRQHGVPAMLLKAIAQVESGENPNAVNPTDPSYGLMQIYYTGSNDLNILGWPPGNKNKLFDPSYNLFIAAQILSWNIEQYGFNKGIAVYNSWSARKDPPQGPYSNQSYVDKVLIRYYTLTSRGNYI